MLTSSPSSGSHSETSLCAKKCRTWRKTEDENVVVPKALPLLVYPIDTSHCCRRLSLPLLFSLLCTHRAAKLQWLALGYAKGGWDSNLLLFSYKMPRVTKERIRPDEVAHTCNLICTESRGKRIVVQGWFRGKSLRPYPKNK
jgi:hypothetical protein